jgi:hypothetical protein
MTRRDVLPVGAAIGVAGAAGCSVPESGPNLIKSFDNGLGNRESTAATEPEVDLKWFDWAVGISEAEAVDGDRSIRV